MRSTKGPSLLAFNNNLLSSRYRDILDIVSSSWLAFGHLKLYWDRVIRGKEEEDGALDLAVSDL